MMARATRVGMLLVMGGSGCATADRTISEVEAIARARSEAEADFKPHRQMAHDGRAHPLLGRQCLEGMAREFRPDLPDGVAASWLALSDLLRLIVTTVPPLIRAAEQIPEQKGSKHRFLHVAEHLPGETAGGVISLRRRKAKPAGVYIRERLDTEDLWRMDPMTGAISYFDGRIEYGAADSPDLPKEGARIRGWAQVWRAPPDPSPFLVGAQVNLLLLYYAGDELQIEGTFVSPCYGPVEVTGRTVGREECGHSPSSRLGEIRFEHGKHHLLLRQDDDACDECVWWSYDDAAPVRFCPTMWAPRRDQGVDGAG